MSEETLVDIEKKRAAWEASRADISRKLAELQVDLFVGAFFAPKTRETFDVVPLSEDLSRISRSMVGRPGVEAFARNKSRLRALRSQIPLCENGKATRLIREPRWRTIRGARP
jgi:hypothetical protein